jgi:hypothetical protein
MALERSNEPSLFQTDSVPFPPDAAKGQEGTDLRVTCMSRNSLGFSQEFLGFMERFFSHKIRGGPKEVTCFIPFRFQLR